MASIQDQLPEDYCDLLIKVKERVHAAQYQALGVVNREPIGLYCGILAG